MLGRVQDWFDRHGSGWTVILGWILTRAVMMLIFATLESFVIGDVYYYDFKIYHLFFDTPLAQTLNEYPDSGGLDPEPSVRPRGRYSSAMPSRSSPG